MTSLSDALHRELPVYVIPRPETGGRRWKATPRKFFGHMEKCFGDNLKLLDTVRKTWAPIRKLF